ncbi:MAG: hypothetical protein J6A16_12095 [Oscillospiraceae bacterium]|nr:hypothetical protein [Oscillospiraceae bacterium]
MRLNLQLRPCWCQFFRVFPTSSEQTAVRVSCLFHRGT